MYHKVGVAKGGVAQTVAERKQLFASVVAGVLVVQLLLRLYLRIFSGGECGRQPSRGIACANKNRGYGALSRLSRRPCLQNRGNVLRSPRQRSLEFAFIDDYRVFVRREDRLQKSTLLAL